MSGMRNRNHGASWDQFRRTRGRGYANWNDHDIFRHGYGYNRRHHDGHHDRNNDGHDHRHHDWYGYRQRRNDHHYARQGVYEVGSPLEGRAIVAVGSFGYGGHH